MDVVIVHVDAAVRPSPMSHHDAAAAIADSAIGSDVDPRPPTSGHRRRMRRTDVESAHRRDVRVVIIRRVGEGGEEDA